MYVYDKILGCLLESYFENFKEMSKDLSNYLVVGKLSLEFKLCYVERFSKYFGFFIEILRVGF